jgi:hemin uptake protein HemP
MVPRSPPGVPPRSSPPPSPPHDGGRAAGVPAHRRWDSKELFGSDHEIEIEHGQSVYRLRLTSLGKLILTK